MLRRFVSAAAVMFLVVGFVLAGEYNGSITEISKDCIKVTVRKKGEKGGEKKEFKVSKDVKVTRMKGEEKIDADFAALEKAFEKAKEKGGEKFRGMQAKIETEGEGDKETVVKISFGGGKKKGGE